MMQEGEEHWTKVPKKVKKKSYPRDRGIIQFIKKNVHLRGGGKIYLGSKTETLTGLYPRWLFARLMFLVFGAK